MLAGSSCGSKPPTPITNTPPPVVEAPGIACPADLKVDASGAAPTVVAYSAPVVSGGAQPVTTNCTITSGTAFPVGISDVVCTARDSASRSASCVFHVTVTPVYKLRGTRFTALGDSIANGEVAAPSDYLPDLAYPHLLEGMLRARYTTQTAVVRPVGAYGKLAKDNYEDLRADLLKSVPDALLILSGVNDINSRDPGQIAVVRDGLQSMIRVAKSSGVQIVFLSTLLPQVVGRSRAYAPELIEPANAMIRALAASEGVILVDNHAALIGQAGFYIGDDGLHPSPAGHQKIAETFFESIKTNYEVPVTQAPARLRR